MELPMMDNSAIFEVFIDNEVCEFFINTCKKEMKLFIDEYYDQEERAFMKTPSVVTIWGWEHADYYESINDYFTPVQPLHDDISPICDIYHYEWENGKLMLWGDQENGMYITLNFQNCHFRFEHVDMSHHVNIFKFMVPESILDREYADLDIPSVKNKTELLACYTKMLRRPWEYHVTWNNIEDYLYDGVFSNSYVMLFHHKDISQMPLKDQEMYADLIKRCNRNNNHCYFIFNEHDYQLMMRLINNSHD
ncbi:MAG: hypothetical protein J6T43_13025 [Prevotella sp.]|nr:hypothetical protein [Prevotella sp.]